MSPGQGRDVPLCSVPRPSGRGLSHLVPLHRFGGLPQAQKHTTREYWFPVRPNRAAHNVSGLRWAVPPLPMVRALPDGNPSR
jgi:hypothetical protein